MRKVSGLVVTTLIIALAAAACSGGGSSAKSTPDATGSPSLTPTGGPSPVTGEEVATDSGLRYIEVEEGTGAVPEKGQTVVANWEVWLASAGRKVYSTYDRGQPQTFPVGEGVALKGFDEGVSTMKVGGKRRLIVPPDLAYGEKGNGGLIPPNSTLIIDVELVDIVS